MKRVLSILALVVLTTINLAYAEAPPDDASLQTGIAETEFLTPSAGRMIEKTATLTIEVKDVDSAHAEAVRLVESKGGLVLSSTLTESSSTSSKSTRADLTISATPDDFLEIVDGLAGLGMVAYKQVNGRDATEEYFDLKGQLLTQMGLKARLTSLLARTGNLNQALEVEEELRRVEDNISNIRNRIAYLETTTMKSTINLTILPRSTASFTRWERVSDWFFGSLTVVVVLLPVAGLALLVTWIVVVIVRRRKVKES